MLNKQSIISNSDEVLMSRRDFAKWEGLQLKKEKDELYNELFLRMHLITCSDRNNQVIPPLSFTSHSFVDPPFYVLNTVTGCWGLCEALGEVLTQMSPMHLFRTDIGLHVTMNIIIMAILDYNAVIMRSKVKAEHN